MNSKIKDVLSTLFFAIIALFLCWIIVTRVSWLGIFIISAIYLVVHIYYYNKDRGRDNFSCILNSALYVILILMSLFQFNKDYERIKEDSFLAGQRYGYEEGYAEGYRDGQNEFEDMFLY